MTPPSDTGAGVRGSAGGTGAAQAVTGAAAAARSTGEGASEWSGRRSAGRSSRSSRRSTRETVPRLVTFLICQGATLADAADLAQDTLVEAMPPVWHDVGPALSVVPDGGLPEAVCALETRGAAGRGPRAGRFPADRAQPRPGRLFEQHQDFLYWLDQLRGDRQRAVLVCTYDGATTDETAELLEMAPANVRSTLRNARESLRRSRTRAHARR